MVLKLLREAVSGWFIVFLLVFIAIILGLINPTLGRWAGKAVGFIIILFLILGVGVVLKNLIKTISNKKKK